MGVKDADKIVETEDDLVPTDPVTENMNAIKNANSIKSIVLTLPYEDFWGTRCRSVMKLFENLKEKVPEIFSNSSQSK